MSVTIGRAYSGGITNTLLAAVDPDQEVVLVDPIYAGWSTACSWPAVPP